MIVIRFSMATFGYARVSTTDQDLTRQLDELKAEGCDRTWSEHASGAKGAKRPEWDDLLSHLREGDTLAVVELSLGSVAMPQNLVPLPTTSTLVESSSES